MVLGEGADGVTDRGQPVLPGGRKIFDEIELGERIGIARNDFGGRESAEEFAQERDEAAHERRIGIGAERAASVAQCADEMHARDAAADEGGVGALKVGEWREFFRAVDDDGEAFLQVRDDGEGVCQLLLFLGEGQGGRQMAWRVAGPPAMRNVRARIGTMAALVGP